VPANPRSMQIYYANNATNLSAETALATSWMGPSITPLTNLNSGFRVYESTLPYVLAVFILRRARLFSAHLHPQTFEILDAHT
jgi:hypothetical protein